MLRFAKFMLVSALMVSIGAQWALVQSVAWVSMAVSYSIKAGSVSEGLSETFDGEHPCELCKIVWKAQQEKEQREQKEKTAEKFKIELCAIDRVCFVISTPSARVMLVDADERGSSFRVAPPKPPPRAWMA